MEDRPVLDWDDGVGGDVDDGPNPPPCLQHLPPGRLDCAQDDPRRLELQSTWTMHNESAAIVDTTKSTNHIISSHIISSHIIRFS